MEPFKNWLGIQAARRIAHAIVRSHSSFQATVFLKGLEAELEPLELKDRMRLLKSRLSETLPKDLNRSVPILLRALQQNPQDAVGLKQFEVWPLTHYIAEEGLHHFDLSMKALHAMTQVFTAEFAIRPFLIHHEKETLKQLHLWTRDPSEHVRRLVSEGSRPLLPWGERLHQFVKDPTLTWPLLEKLKSDSSLYVRKSVANHINDHAKNHDAWVLKNLKTWGQSSKEILWIVRHGTRTLIKQGHPEALALQGVSSHALKRTEWNIRTPRIRIGETLVIDCQIENASSSACKVIIDVNLGLMGSRGQLRSKIFKGCMTTFSAKEKRSITIKIPIRKVTTRAYYLGKQSCSLLINGKQTSKKYFELRSS